MIKDLPKDLLSAAGSILDESSKLRRENYRQLVAQALQHFKVQSFSQLSESEQRMFTEWVTSRLDEEVCTTCGLNCICQKEDDDLLHLKAKVDAHSGLPELGEEEEKEVQEEDEDKVEESCSSCEDDLKEDDMPDDAVFHKGGDEDAEKKKDLGEQYASPEPASAIGRRLDVELPKHADVIKDVSAPDAVVSYRLLVQFVNGRPEIIPPVDLPGAPSVESLGDLISGLDDPNGVISAALADALDIPSERSEYRGNDKD